MGATLITSNVVTIESLKEVELPEKTHSYQPVSHIDFIDNVKNIANKMLPEKTLDTESYGTARDGKQLFGTMTFRNNEDTGLSLNDMIDDVGLSIGIRNSYDKSMSLGMCVGATVFVCENLMMNGEITVMRKHQGRILDALNALIFNALMGAEDKFQTLHHDATVMKEITLSDKEAYSMLGRLYGFGVISERQLPIVKREWTKPSHASFDNNSVWTLYNAGTEALKKTTPMNRMNKQIKLHNTFEKEFSF
jgi:hypothetical protein